MPNSLRSKLSKLRYKGEITQEEYFELIKKLDGHDLELLDMVAHELKETFNNECPINYTSTQPFFTLENVRTLVDMVIKDMKAEVVR